MEIKPLLKLPLLLLLIVGTFEVFGQIQVNPKKIQFGDFTAETESVVDIMIDNTGSQRDFLLRATFSHEFEVLYSSKTLEPGGNITIRIRFNPREKGAFEENVELYFASMQKPIILPIRANVEYVNVNGKLPCPDFSQRAAECCAQNMFVVEVLDKETLKPIPGAFVKVEEDGYMHLKVKTNDAGRVSQEARIGFYLISAEKAGYKKASKDSYINKNNNRFQFFLERDPNFKPEDVLIIPAIDSAQVLVPSDTTLLSLNIYKANNIVFLLDVSSSMSKGEKLELMKKALIALTDVLRPIDQITLISYADQAKTLMPTTTGDQKETMIGIVREITANGATSGAKGFRKSYESIMAEYLKEGNNQLIVITDGAFKPEDQIKIDKLVKKYARKNIRTSVVAIQSNTFAKEKLAALAVLGNGSFLMIENEGDADAALIEEIKKQSVK